MCGGQLVATGFGLTTNRQPTNRQLPPQALMKYYNDPEFLAKLGDKLGDVAPAVGAPAAAVRPPPAAAAAAAPTEAPEINNIRDAAKWVGPGGKEAREEGRERGRKGERGERGEAERRREGKACGHMHAWVYGAHGSAPHRVQPNNRRAPAIRRACTWPSPAHEDAHGHTRTMVDFCRYVHLQTHS